MREFMTKVSDYISERRNDPEKNGNILVFCMLGIVVLIIIIFCLLLLWRKHTDKKEQEITAETFTYVPETVMSKSPDEEELKQEYLSNMEYLEEKVESLILAMSDMQKSLEETVIMQQDDNTYFQEQVEEITRDIKNMIVRLQNTQNHLYDVTDMINIMQKETIPEIQEQISGLEEQISQANTDISAIYAKIDSLEVADEELQAKLKEIEGTLKASVEQNMNDVTNQFSNMNVRIEEIIKQMQELTSQFLRYWYDEGSNTLYLYSD
ncbi:MAG: hypothetical protein NC231_11455 [Bacillus sp. (in: Bacteria)]|nr:hypothetical protein [Bacillus sp. (in: firmicutes)]MCM1426273.1 hypothetical protein [Eubacterium sp.]